MGTKGILKLVWLGREGDLLRIVQEIQTLQTNSMHKAESNEENEMHKMLWDFKLKNGPINPGGHKTRTSFNSQKSKELVS